MNGDAYEKDYIDYCNSELGKKIAELEAELIRKELKGCKKILDVGCGIGVFEELLPDLNITGLDTSQRFLEEAKNRIKKEFVFGNAENLPFDDNTFDGVFSVATLEFVENYKAAVREIYRVLKPGGKIVILITNSKSAYVRAQKEKRNSYYNRIPRINLRDMRECFVDRFKLKRKMYKVGVRGNQTFIAKDKQNAILFVIIGEKWK